METSHENHFVKRVNELVVYRLAFGVAMDIYQITKTFPPEERYSLTDQIRRSSRSVCSNLSEGWSKRKYIAAYISKISDCVQQAEETQTWLEFSSSCGYLDRRQYDDLKNRMEIVIAKLITMQIKAKSFCKSGK